MKINSYLRAISLQLICICICSINLPGLAHASGQPAITSSKLSSAGSLSVEVNTGSIANSIAEVKLFINNTKVGEKDFYAPYIWNWKAGNYAGNTVVARAVVFDRYGKRYEVSRVIDLSQATTQPSGTYVPRVSFKGLPKTVSGKVNIEVEASDPKGIGAVNLYASNVLVGKDTSEPYTFNWNSTAYAGSTVDVEAVAINKVGNRSSIAADIDVEATRQSNQCGAKLLFKSDFETGSIRHPSQNPDGWSKHNMGLKHGIEVKRGFARSGNYSAKLFIDRNDWNGTNTLQGIGNPRAQLAKTNQYLPLQMETEYWMGVSTYIPSDWQNEKNIGNNVTLWQFHGTKGGPGEGAAPPLSLDIKGNKFVIANRFGNVSERVTARNIWTGNLEKGRWVDWVVRVKFSLTNGYIRVWKNGNKIAEVSGVQTIYRGKDASRINSPLYMILSLYKPKFVQQPSNVKNHTIYYDEFRLAQGQNGKQQVTPAGNCN